MTDDWTRRAEREAAAILDGFGRSIQGKPEASPRAALIDLLAAAWLQGAILGSHESLAGLEVSFEQMQARL